jgi:predicted nucleic acid-binding Zn ribbon protein
MPIYLYQNPNTGKVIEVFQAMKDDHIFFDEDGVEYKRVFTAPNYAIDSKIDPFSAKDFTEKTRNKKGTIGDLLNQSKELSEKRGGESNDPVLKKYLSSYQQEKGVKHTSQVKKEKFEKANKKLKKFGVSITD